MGVRACGMHSTDEVWVAGKEETAIALMDFGGGSVGFWFGFSFPQIWVLVAIANGVV